MGTIMLLHWEENKTPSSMLYIVFVDGLGYHHLDEAWTDDARWCIPLQNQLPSITAPNWASLLSGVKTATHGVLDNHQTKTFGDRTTFMHERPGSVLVVSDWAPFRHLTPGLPFVHDRTPLRNLRLYAADTVLVNLDRLDSRAHKYGWDSPQAQVTRSNLARELAAFRTHLEETNVDYTMLVVADHGGYRKNHEAAHNERVRTIPLLLYSNRSRYPARPRIRTSLALKKWITRNC